MAAVCAHVGPVFFVCIRLWHAEQGPQLTKEHTWSVHAELLADWAVKRLLFLNRQQCLGGRADGRPGGRVVGRLGGRAAGWVGRPGGSVADGLPGCRAAGRTGGRAAGRRGGSVGRSVGRWVGLAVGARLVGRSEGPSVGWPGSRAAGRAGRSDGRTVGRADGRSGARAVSRAVGGSVGRVGRAVSRSAGLPVERSVGWALVEFALPRGQQITPTPCAGFGRRSTSHPWAKPPPRDFFCWLARFRARRTMSSARSTALRRCRRRRCSATCQRPSSPSSS